MQDRIRENTHRIINALDRAETHEIKQMAMILNYEPIQLQKDIQSLMEYIKRTEQED